ncbi:zinc-dependent metalloprotease [Dyadobacter sp. CY343]|uniref:zinc-dependent metalloprotease n=1 Tax=Dyadobacter sp. CY343 TaxID=2907299 RepID=UPI001F40119C|nr:zinc-dependent metalloprotease [Dyadobacter sp. CY343]MCE7062652.1 M12 family metallo-peptidase [Dyadobacter sp. CY343]
MQTSFTIFARNFLATWLLLSLTTTLTFSQQSNFIEPVAGPDVPDSREMDAFKARLRKNPNISAFQFVKLNALATSQQDGILKLRIPNTSPITAEATHVEYHDEHNYEWIGKTDDGLGTVIVLSKEGRICAHISTPQGVYEIFPAPGNLYSLQEIDPIKAGDVGCATTSENRTGGRENAEYIPATPEPVNSNPSSDANAKLYPCQPLVNPRVLVLYTAKALQIAGDVATITDQANISVAQFNSTIYNSGITSNAVLTLAGVAPLNFPETNNNMTLDITNLPGNAAAQSLRTQFQADLVVLFTNGNYGARGATAIPFLNNASAYSIVQILNAVTNKTFAHEVGHIYGCRHDGESGDPQYAQGHNMKNGLGIVTDRTMMSTNTNDGSNRLLNFSNPNVIVGGKSTGTLANNNNAKRITETHLIVGGFKPNPVPPLVAYLDGPTFVTTQGGKNYELNYSCGSAPYSFTWQYSYDGVNYIASNITTEVFTWYFYQNQKIYLKGTVSANGKSTTAFIAVTAQMPSPFKTGNTEADSLINENQELSVIPNPVADEMRIGYYLETEAAVELEILDLSGNFVESILPKKSLQSRGLHSLSWSNDGLENGSYLLRLIVNEKTEVKRIIIQR